MLELLNELETSIKRLVLKYDETKAENEKYAQKQKESDDLITASTVKINFLKDEIAKLELDINQIKDDRKEESNDATIIHSSY